MSLKTRCPACDTIFKVVPDQLKISSGWVRCGRCAEVFDATSHAVDAISPSSPIAPSAITANESPVENINNAIINSNNIAKQPINTPATDILDRNNGVIEKSPSLPAVEAQSDLSFVRMAQNKAFWQRTSVVRSLRVACVGLAGLLFFQITFSQRNHLAAVNPSFKAGLETACQTLGCTVEPLKSIDAFKIDSSSFQKTQASDTQTANADLFALKLAIKNNADMAISMPAIELTLTDANDKAVLRRVLLTKELGYKGETLAANSDWNGSMSVAVTPSTASPSISGYRVLLFYP